MTPRAALELGVRELGITLPQAAAEQLLAYLGLLQKWNRTYNLTAVRDPLRMVSHHLLDSLAVLPFLPAGPLADVGSGAGLPGIPLAIAAPQREVTLNDANDKMASFLRQAVIELSIGNATVHQERVENWRPLERFAVVISRGYAELAQFVADCRHLVTPRGALAAMKGLLHEDELARLPADCDCSEVHALRVPRLEAERHLVVCRARL